MSLKESLKLKSKKDLYIILLGVVIFVAFIAIQSGLFPQCADVLGYGWVDYITSLCWIIGPNKFWTIPWPLGIISLFLLLYIKIRQKNKQTKFQK